MGYQSKGSMRLAGGKSPFDTRVYEVDKDPKRLFIIFTEGVATEQKYFIALSKSKNLKDNIDIKVLDRWKENSGRSNQYYIIQDIINYINDIDSIEDCDKKKFIAYFTQIVEGCNYDTLMNVSQKIPKLAKKYPNLISATNHIQQQLLSVATVTTYNKDFDKICIVMDRDKHSFSQEQYDQVIELCNENDFYLGISNPCFEFFLLLHLDDLLSEDRIKILENEKNGKKTLVELLLDEKMKEVLDLSFHKTNYNVDYFIENYEIGKKNIGNYSTKNTELKNNVGTSLFFILEQLLK